MKNAVGTEWFRFPSREITWDANNDVGAERGPYTALSKPASTQPKPGEPADPNFSTGQAEMAIPVTITFNMTTDCEKLKDFFREYAVQDNGWLDSDGNVTEGWVKTLTRYISQPAEQTIVAVTQRYPWQKIWNDEEVRKEYVKTLKEELPKITADRTGGVSYFEDFQVIVYKPYPTNEDLRRNAEQIQANQAAADAERIRLTAQAEAQRAAAEAQQAAAEAQRAAEQARAGVRAEEIRAFGEGPEAVDAWLREQCMQIDTCHQYDPSPIIAGAR